MCPGSPGGEPGSPVRQAASAGPAAPQLDPLSLHDALPIYLIRAPSMLCRSGSWLVAGRQQVLRQRRDGLAARSEEHTAELQSHHDLVCRLLLEKKKKRRLLGVASTTLYARSWRRRGRSSVA